jgi:hypothetical protein
LCGGGFIRVGLENVYAWYRSTSEIFYAQASVEKVVTAFKNGTLWPAMLAFAMKEAPEVTARCRPRGPTIEPLTAAPLGNFILRYCCWSCPGNYDLVTELENQNTVPKLILLTLATNLPD